ncbi:MAG: hypothetical protein E7399_03340 [Ruminococcaceae bacterium]|nr:hypothetical protein [Oscillospiraceae bacterium]
MLKRRIVIMVQIMTLIILFQTPVTFASEPSRFEYVTPCEWQHVSNFSEGYAAVQGFDFNGQEGKWGFIDRYGELVVPLVWDDVGSFSEGLAAVCLDGKWGYIDYEGSVVIPLQFGHTHAYEFHEGMAEVYHPETIKSGYINKQGEIVVPLEYDTTTGFSDGWGNVWNRNGDVYQYFVFDKNGVENDQWSRIFEYSEGLAWAWGPAGRGYVDKSGNLVISIPENYHGNSFHNGLALIKDLTGEEFFYIDSSGNRVIKPPFKLHDEPGDFNQGYALVHSVSQNSSSYKDVIDTKGTVVATIQRNGSIAYNEEMKTAFLANKNGDKIANVYSFSGDLSIFKDICFYPDSYGSVQTATVAKKTIENKIKYGIFDETLSLMIPFEYDEITVLSDEFFAVANNEKGNLKAIINEKNQLVSDYEFSTVFSAGEDRYIVRNATGDYGVIRMQNDGELYHKADQEEIIGTAKSVTFFVNDVLENAYEVNGKVYARLETLKKYGVISTSSNDGEQIVLRRQESKKQLRESTPFLIQEEYFVYQSSHQLFIGETKIDSLKIDKEIVVNVDELHSFGTLLEDNGTKRLYIDRPYLANEGITWEWRTDMHNVYLINLGTETYSLRDVVSGIQIYHDDGTFLYEDKSADSAVFQNGVWKVTRGYPDKYVDYVGEDGKLAESPQEETSVEPTPLPSIEYPKPVYYEKSYRTNKANVSRGKYVNENGTVVLENADWFWTDPFVNGTALVNVGGVYTTAGSVYQGKWGLIDTEGNYIVEPVWDSATRIEDGTAIVTIDQKKSLVDQYGNEKFPIEYDWFSSWGKFAGKTIFYAKKGENHFLISNDNQVLLPGIFSYIGQKEDNLFSVSADVNQVYMTGLVSLIEIPFLPGKVYVDGEEVIFPKPPLLIKDRTMIPVRAVFEKLNYTVNWDGETQTVLIDGHEMNIQIPQDKNGFYKNGKFLYSDMPAINYGDRIYLPLRAITEALGCKVEYNEESSDVSIFSKLE